MMEVVAPGETERRERWPEYGGHPRVLLAEDMTGEKCCVRVVRQIRPNWKKCDIILWKLSPTSWASYSVKNTRDKLLIKLFPEETQSARYLNTFQLYSELGLSPHLLGGHQKFIKEKMESALDKPAFLVMHGGSGSTQVRTYLSIIQYIVDYTFLGSPFITAFCDLCVSQVSRIT